VNVGVQQTTINIIQLVMGTKLPPTLLTDPWALTQDMHTFVRALRDLARGYFLTSGKLKTTPAFPLPEWDPLDAVAAASGGPAQQESIMSMLVQTMGTCAAASREADAIFPAVPPTGKTYNETYPGFKATAQVLYLVALFMSGNKLEREQLRGLLTTTTSVAKDLIFTLIPAEAQHRWNYGQLMFLKVIAQEVLNVSFDATKLAPAGPSVASAFGVQPMY